MSKTANLPMHFLDAFQAALPYLGLPAPAFKLVSWLFTLTQPGDWEVGYLPIAWPSTLCQAEYLGLSIMQAKALNRALIEAGIFIMRTSRWASATIPAPLEPVRSIAAHGFDLSPLALRYNEFVWLAAIRRNLACASQGRPDALQTRH